MRSRTSSLGAMQPETLADLANLRRARDFMDREYDRPLDVAAVARRALMSPAHFSRRFRAVYGETPYAYLMTRRIERAASSASVMGTRSSSSAPTNLPQTCKRTKKRRTLGTRRGENLREKKLVSACSTTRPP